MQVANLLELETPGGSRSPVVVHSDGQARAVLIALEPGQELGEHQVKENAYVAIVEGSARVESGGETIEAPTGTFLAFGRDERHAISSEGGARLLLLLAPWPGEGHYRGEERAL
ncbi:MAG: cupin domain-containing protein [Actinobacteria bacterium]|nr:cupin domain-containing protein [Actinomycetota bacterium]